MKAARIAAGLTHRQASTSLDVDQSIIWRWETGDIAPRDEIRPRIAELYGVDVDTLFRHANGDEEPEPAPVG